MIKLAPSSEDPFQREFDASELPQETNSKVEENVAEFLEQVNEMDIQRFDDIWNIKTDAIMSNVDIEDVWFSLKDVMELTLLHTQQLHIMDLTHK